MATQKLYLGIIVIIIIIIIILAALYVTGALSGIAGELGRVGVTATCSDTDGAQNPDLKGTCTDSTKTTAGLASFADRCVSDASVIEYYCSDSRKCVSTILLCTGGKVCIDGVCVAANQAPRQSAVTDSPDPVTLA